MRTSTSSRPKKAETLRQMIGREAKLAGFDAVAVTAPDAIPLAPARLKQFVAEGFHGSMGWIAETLERRADPRALWPEVRSIIVLAMNYGPDRDPRDLLEKRDRGAISVYAQNRDYHDVIKGTAEGDRRTHRRQDRRRRESVRRHRAGHGKAARRGRRHRLAGKTLQSRQPRIRLVAFSWLIFTTAEIEPDTAEEDHCGSCRACLDACPTDAFPAPYRLDARRCISYLTIENKGPIPHEFREAIGNRIYGCDDCLAACPWNKFARQASEAKLAARDDLREPKLAELLTLDDAAFRTLFSGSPVKRIGRDRFLRNVLIAAGNSGDSSLVAHCRALLDDASPLVRGAAVWALSRLLPQAEFKRLAAQRAH